MGCYYSSYSNIFFKVNNEKSEIRLIKQTITKEYIINDKNEIAFEKIEKGKKVEKLISIINLILQKANNFSKESISKFQKIIKNIFNDSSLNVNGKKIYSIKMNNNFDFKEIKNYCEIFKIIDNNKSKIKKQTLIYLIESIIFLLKEENVLETKDINFLSNKLKQIFLGENNFNESLSQISSRSRNKPLDLIAENYNYFRNKDFHNIKNNNIYKTAEKINNLNDFKDLENLSNVKSDKSCFSKKSEYIIKKFEEKREQLKSIIEIEQSSNNIKREKLIKLKFSIMKENKEYPLEIKVDEKDKFSFIIDALYEKYPEIEEKGIKKFIFNDKILKRNDYIESIQFNDYSIIFIDF